MRFVIRPLHAVFLLAGLALGCSSSPSTPPPVGNQTIQPTRSGSAGVPVDLPPVKRD
jgi:hypothetical protein